MNVLYILSILKIKTVDFLACRRKIHSLQTEHVVKEKIEGLHLKRIKITLFSTKLQVTNLDFDFPKMGEKIRPKWYHGMHINILNVTARKKRDIFSFGV